MPGRPRLTGDALASSIDNVQLDLFSLLDEEDPEEEKENETDES